MSRSLSLLLAAGLATGVYGPSLHASEGVAPQAAELLPRAAEDLLTHVAVAGKRLIAAGDRGHILLSDDHGDSWRQVAIPVRVLFTSAYFVDDQQGWVVGHDATILKTRDGGETWAIQRFEPGDEPLLDIHFSDARTGFAIGAYGQFLRTADGGQSWELDENELSEEGLHLNAVGQLNDGSLLLVGEQGMLARSTDAGQTWERLESPYESSLFAVDAHGASGAVMAGLRGNVFISNDVAEGSWQPVDTGSVQSVFGIASSNGHFLLAGLNSSLVTLGSDGQVVRSAVELVAQGRPTGDTLSPRREQEGSGYAHVLALDDQHFLTVGDAGVRKWKLQSAN